MGLENKLQKTLTKELAVMILTAFTSLNGCVSGLSIKSCPEYTNNTKKIEITKMDSINAVMNYHKQNYQLNN